MSLRFHSPLHFHVALVASPPYLCEAKQHQWSFLSQLPGIHIVHVVEIPYNGQKLFRFSDDCNLIWVCTREKQGQTMAHGAFPSPDMGRNKVATTPNSYRERTTNGVHKPRSSSMGAGLGDFPAVGVPPSFINYVSPLRSLYSTTAPPCRVDAVAPVTTNPKANPGPSHALASSQNACCHRHKGQHLQP